MRRRTKIICTLGPAVASRTGIKKLIASGMNVARINCAYGDWETRKQWIDWIRELSPKAGPIGVLIDLQGLKIRLGEIPGGEATLEIGDVVTVGHPGSQLPIPNPALVNHLHTGDRLLLGDDAVEVRVQSVKSREIRGRVVSPGNLKSRQGVTLADKPLAVNAITPKDRKDIADACAVGVDFIALSFVQTTEDIESLRRLVNKHDPAVRICAKIETKQALRDIEDIARLSDLVMVARGDLGLQMDIADVPFAQKKVIRVCNDIGRPVITATQMLESMMKSPRPTRAEAADVANAILDGTDAVMLSGETARGNYPFLAVQTMARIAVEADKDFDHAALMRRFLEERAGKGDLTESVAHAVAQLADLTQPAAIVTNTTSGQTARLVSKYRPRQPVLCATSNARTHTQMSAVWGVEAILIPKPRTTDETIANAVKGFVANKRLKVGDQVIVTAGVPPGIPGNTNLILCQDVK